MGRSLFISGNLPTDDDDKNLLNVLVATLYLGSMPLDLLGFTRCSQNRYIDF